MPLVLPNDIRIAPVSSAPRILTRPKVEEDTPDFMQLLGAASVTVSTPGSAMLQFFANQQIEDEELDPDFDAADHLEGFEEFADAILENRTLAGVKRTQLAITLRRQAHMDLASGGWKGFAASFGAAVLDPLLVLPGSAGLRLAAKGKTALSVAGRTAAVLAATVAPQEEVLAALSDLHTQGDVAINVALAAALGAPLGFVGAKLASKATRKQVKKELGLGETPADAVLDTPVPKTAGAAVTPEAAERAVFEAREAKLKSAFGAITLLKKLNPMLRVATSPVRAARQLMQEMAETPLLFRDFAGGVKALVPTGTLITRMKETLNGETVLKMRDFYGKYRKRIQGTPEKALSRAEFRRAAGKAARRGQVHAIPEVEQFSKFVRKTIFEEFGERLAAAGVIPKGVTDNVRYLTRLYLPEKINGFRGDWNNALKPWLAKSHPDLAPEELDDIANQIAEHITHVASGRNDYSAITVTTRKSGKAREIILDDIEIEDFLEDDIMKIVQFYLRTMAPDLIFAERYGDVLATKALDRVADEYRKLIAAAKTPKAKQKLATQQGKDMDDLVAVRDIQRGIFSLPSSPNSGMHRLSLISRRVGLITKMHNVLISSFPDIARPAMTQGLARALTGEVSMMMMVFRNMGKLTPELTADLKASAAFYEWINNTKTRALFDLGDDFGRVSVAEKGLGVMADKFGTTSLLGPWNKIGKMATGTLVGDRLISLARRIAAGKRLRTRDREFLSLHGLDDDDMRIMADMYAKSGSHKFGALRIGNTTQWSDRRIAEKFANAMKREQDSAIVTPGSADLPLWIRTQVGSTFGLARSFSFAAVNNILIAGLQRHDMAFVNGVFMSVFAGMMVYAMKTRLAGRPLSDDPAVWITEGIDRSGLLGILADVNLFIERATRGLLGMSMFTGRAPLTRFAARGAPELFFGIPASQTRELFELVGDIATYDGSRVGRHIRRWIPYTNAWYIQGVLRAVEEGQK